MPQKSKKQPKTQARKTLPYVRSSHTADELTEENWEYFLDDEDGTLMQGCFDCMSRYLPVIRKFLVSKDMLKAKTNLEAFYLRQIELRKFFEKKLFEGPI